MEKITKNEFTNILSKNLSVLMCSTGYTQRFLDINEVESAIQKSIIDNTKIKDRARGVIKFNDSKIIFTNNSYLGIKSNKYNYYSYYKTLNKDNQQFLIQHNRVFDEFENEYFNYYVIYLILT